MNNQSAIAMAERMEQNPGDQQLSDGSIQTMLVISDLDQEALGIKSLFRDDYKVLTAKNEAEALHIKEFRAVDLIFVITPFSDLNHQHAVQVIAGIAKRSDKPFVVMSNIPNEVEEVQVRKYGGLDYFGCDTPVQIIYTRIRNQMALLKEKKALMIKSSVDAMTGLTNRSHFNLTFENEWRRASRGLHPLSLILIDIDEFKLFNDTFGHVAGDHCLIKVARTIRETASRESDTVARFGGEEFAVIMPFVDAEGAKLVAGQILNAIRALAIPHSKNAKHDSVTVSLGVSTFHPSDGCSTISEPIDLIKTADSSLYKAKSNGRNTVVVN
ncbi:GGDEF domain-containing response regulator [Alteromonas oceanisediminis]|uniref:GGDEF domain-containing response regulator n=1 Tax=Alteromonas oceanisediminis TaxID=2836180 RepID=UPI001BDB0A93|nr:diguanylate cyclase [Alteromonas oceanisediminis]MBT0585120.1 diguanylate cyclase [Alteromonas oceanisediminis]